MKKHIVCLGDSNSRSGKKQGNVCKSYIIPAPLLYQHSYTKDILFYFFYFLSQTVKEKKNHKKYRSQDLKKIHQKCQLFREFEAGKRVCRIIDHHNVKESVLIECNVCLSRKCYKSSRRKSHGEGNERLSRKNWH